MKSHHFLGIFILAKNNRNAGYRQNNGAKHQEMVTTHQSIRGRLGAELIWVQRIGSSVIDDGITTSDTTIPSIELEGPITRSRAQQLRRQVNSFLCSSANDRENRLLPNDLIVITNQGVDHREHAGYQEGVGEPRKHAQHGGCPSQFRIQESDFESTRSPGPPCLQIDVHDASDLRFG
jgi:hypothetical protein